MYESVCVCGGSEVREAEETGAEFKRRSSSDLLQLKVVFTLVGQSFKSGSCHRVSHFVKKTLERLRRERFFQRGRSAFTEIHSSSVLLAGTRWKGFCLCCVCNYEAKAFQGFCVDSSLFSLSKLGTKPEHWWKEPWGLHIQLFLHFLS